MSFLIKPDLHGRYPVVHHAKGSCIFDQFGKRYLDGCSGAVTCNLGHGVPEVIAPLKEQLDAVSFVYRSQFTSEPAEQLAELLADVLPQELNWSFFVNSGSEAVETAMKIAVQYWQEKGQQAKTIFLSRWNSYHGITNGALSLSGFYERRYRFTHLLHKYPAASAPNCYRCPFELDPFACKEACANEVELAIKRIGKQFIAGFVAEPVIGAAGAAITAPDHYYKKIKEVCEANDILFIADEVMSGMGRTGKMLAIEHWGVTPDIAVLGKGMSAGYSPIAAAVLSDDIMETIKKGSGVIMSGHTYSANPFSAAAALAVLRYIVKHDLPKKAAVKGERLKKELEEIMKQSKIIGDIRGKGLLLGVEFVSDKKSKTPFPASMELSARIISEAKRRGLLIYPAQAGIDGGEGDAVIIAPPLTVSEAEMKELVQIFRDSVHMVEKQAEKVMRADDAFE
ncbi:aspartate aminotransferase family protein [Bacillus sonorensis]|uniref:aspartate aminotransferase family protein n=1 Tax=Bacillus sonorensis TaxID=119858 RepID=UPI002281636C|nr:aspartate aminotransferase family protein [Bacillus sonorensis]MCZ0067840.1 aspartate aminotransferase family protein [Bacillus sonorensis]MCZ0098256.1 aspartate aminotransferase family protein [Bacillus sonorensis]MEC1516500.1 aspartate aminotransferase family protein [Bacillus sonorensis]